VYETRTDLLSLRTPRRAVAGTPCRSPLLTQQAELIESYQGLFHCDVPPPLLPKSEVPSANKSHPQSSRWRLSHASRAATDHTDLATGCQLPTCVHVWISPTARPGRRLLFASGLPATCRLSTSTTKTIPEHTLVLSKPQCPSKLVHRVPGALASIKQPRGFSPGTASSYEETTTATATASPSQLLPRPDWLERLMSRINVCHCEDAL
jgi:hypothetical protein